MPAAVPFRAAPAVALGGARWAGILCAALLAGYALLAARLWLGPGAQETVIQQPVGPADLPPEHAEVTAPDPGDNP